MARFIISHHRFKEHNSLGAAIDEVERLRERHPDRSYCIYATKTRFAADEVAQLADARRMIRVGDHDAEVAQSW